MDTDTAWQMWGERDPYYGVLTDPKYRSAALTPESKDEFFMHGRNHVTHVIDSCRRYVDPQFVPQRVLEFGCGVGRVAIPFAALAAEVIAMDIATSMLDEAKRNCTAFGAGNVQLVLADDELSNAHGQFDLVHSCIVLQHIDVLRGQRLFQLLTSKVKPGGCGAIHVTFAWTRYADNFGQPLPAVVPPPPSLWATVRSSLRQWLRLPLAPVPAPETVDADPEMQMNYYNLSALQFILMQAGVTRVFTELTDHGGALGAMLFFQRPL